MKQLIALVFLCTPALAEPTYFKMSFKISKQHVVISNQTMLVTDTDCASSAGWTKQSSDLFSVGVCPVAPDKIAVWWLVRENDHVDMGSAVHARTPATFAVPSMQSPYEVEVTVER
jgi:hypothetical protein